MEEEEQRLEAASTRLRGRLVKLVTSLLVIDYSCVIDFFMLQVAGSHFLMSRAGRRPHPEDCHPQGRGNPVLSASSPVLPSGRSTSILLLCDPVVFISQETRQVLQQSSSIYKMAVQGV